MVVLGGGGGLMSEVPLYSHDLARRLCSSSSPVQPSFRALSGRLKLRHSLGGGCRHEGRLDCKKNLSRLFWLSFGVVRFFRCHIVGRFVCVQYMQSRWKVVQGYLAHKKTPSPLGTPEGPRYRPTVGS